MGAISTKDGLWLKNGIIPDCWFAEDESSLIAVEQEAAKIGWETTRGKCYFLFVNIGSLFVTLDCGSLDALRKIILGLEAKGVPVRSRVHNYDEYMQGGQDV